MKKISKPWSVTIPKIARVGGVNFIEIPPAQGNQSPSEDDYYPSLAGYTWYRFPLPSTGRTGFDNAGNPYTVTGDTDEFTIEFTGNTSNGYDSIYVDIGQYMPSYNIVGLGFEVVYSGATLGTIDYHEAIASNNGTWFGIGSTNTIRRLNTGDRLFVRLNGTGQLAAPPSNSQVVNTLGFPQYADTIVTSPVTEWPKIGFHRNSLSGHTHVITISNLRYLVAE